MKMHQLKISFLWTMILVLLKFSLLSAYAESKPDFKNMLLDLKEKKFLLTL